MKTKDHERFKIITLVSVILISVLLPVYAETNIQRVKQGQGGDYVARRYAAVSQWPTGREKEEGNANADEIQEAVQSFNRWTKRVLRAEFIPANLTQTVFGLKRWEEGKNDVLFSEYQVDDVRFRISDTPTTFIVMIASSRLSKQSGDWDMFISDGCLGFLEGSERLRSYQALHVTEIDGEGIFRVNLVLPRPREDVRYSELWCQGNPTLWTDRNTVTIEVRKLVGVGEFPVDKDFGIGQRFPPLRTLLKNASLVELTRYLTEERNPTERGVAVDLLCERADAQSAIPVLISAYKSAKGDGLKMDIIQTLEMLTTKYRGASVEQVKELAETSLLKQNSMKLQSLLTRVLRNLEKEEQK